MDQWEFIQLCITLTDFIPDSGSLKFRIDQNRPLDTTAWFRKKTVLKTHEPFFERPLHIKRLKRSQPAGADVNFNKNKLNPKLSDHYVYLLMDPRGISHTECSLKDFLSGIFYVGKGKNDRAIQHMHEVRRALVSGDNVTNNEKIDRIHKIWSVDQDAKILKCCRNISEEEANTKEALLIDTLGIEKLCNKNKGKYRGDAATWSRQKKLNEGHEALKLSWKKYRMGKASSVKCSQQKKTNLKVDLRNVAL